MRCVCIHTHTCNFALREAYCQNVKNCLQSLLPGLPSCLLVAELGRREQRTSQTQLFYHWLLKHSTSCRIPVFWGKGPPRPLALFQAEIFDAFQARFWCLAVHFEDDSSAMSGT